MEKDRRKLQLKGDLGILVHKSQQTSTQVQRVIRKANGILTFISKGKEYIKIKIEYFICHK